jgi:hypothetical protein
MRYAELNESQETKHYLDMEFGEDTALITAPIVDVQEDSVTVEVDETAMQFIDALEAEYQGRKVKLNKPTRGDVKKVNFGHGGTSAKRKTMRIRKSNPARRKSFRARHNCDNPGPKTKARYWSCRNW